MDRADLLTWQGVKALCDVEIKIHEAQVLRPTIAAGQIVFASRGWRLPWRPAWVPLVTQPCVLVTAYHDRGISDVPCRDIFATPIRHWFGVQVKTTHPQLTAMPIGIEPETVPYLQAAERRETRDVLCYMNFSMVNRWPHALRERRLVWKHFRQQPWVTREQRVSPAHHATMLGRAKFVLSPMGNGWDCYRTYEAIAMGAIPIVRRMRPVSNVCESLPVLIVENWAEVTPERLAHEWEHRHRKDTRTITMSYWREQIQGAVKHVR